MRTLDEFDCVLIDTAFHEGLNRRLRLDGVAFISLFDDTPEHALEEVAPLLIPLSQCPPGWRRRVLDLGSRAPCLTAFKSRLASPVLARHLRQLHSAQIEGGGEMLVRWYDTRIQPVWHRLLNPLQRRTVMTNIDKWLYCGRFGEWAEVSVEPESGAPATADTGHAAATPMVLSERQFGQLVDAAQADLVIRHLTGLIPDEVSRVEPRALFRFVSEQIVAAIKLGYEGLYDQTQYMLPGLYTSGAACMRNEFLEAVGSIGTATRAGTPGLADRIASLDEDVWRCGPPLWQTEPAASRPDFLDQTVASPSLTGIGSLV